MRKFFKAFVRDERGVSALEYAMMAGIVAATLAIVGAAFSTKIQAVFTAMTASVSTASTS